MKYSYTFASLSMLGCALALPAPQFSGFPGFGGGDDEGSVPTGLPTPTGDFPFPTSGFPTGLPTGLPTGFPTDLPIPSGFPGFPGFPGGGEGGESPFPSGFPGGEEGESGEGSELPTPTSTTEKRQFPGLGGSDSGSDSTGTETGSGLGDLFPSGFPDLSDIFPSGFPDLGDLFPGFGGGDEGEGGSAIPTPTSGFGGFPGGGSFPTPTGEPFPSGFPDSGAPGPSGFPSQTAVPFQG
ncbi:hypothetical protein BJX68DRAFT_210266 [Aspergillus pseudodeflectus]|uniref:Extracellular proline-glycine rich protein n=1 Tax=Aspergillus pseudodeflectus TaxID=176178 RepID=A0ABR4JFM3_9EURO